MVHARLILLVTVVLGLGLLGASPRAQAQPRNTATDTVNVNPGLYVQASSSPDSSDPVACFDHVWRDARNALQAYAGRCPTYTVFKDYGHLSQGYSVGTTDTSVSGPILEVLRKVK